MQGTTKHTDRDREREKKSQPENKIINEYTSRTMCTAWHARHSHQIQNTIKRTDEKFQMLILCTHTSNRNNTFFFGPILMV